MSSFLAFDTSNYTTSCAVVKDGEVILNRKIPIPVDDGKCGVRQSDAVFHHTVNLDGITDGTNVYSFDAIGVSDKPRSVEGSYMPCFLSGVAAASVMSGILGIPLYSFSHQQGHIMAALYGAGKRELYHEKIIAFHLSGGTTEMLLCDDGRIDKIGGTLDISVGKLIDRTGVKCGLSFPCGPALEKEAEDYDIPSVKIKNTGAFANLSGCENKIDDMIKKCEHVGLISAYAIGCCIGAVTNMLDAAYEEYGRHPVLFAGGVSSNGRIRDFFEKRDGALFPDRAFAADNAAGIALLTEERYENGK